MPLQDTRPCPYLLPTDPGVLTMTKKILMVASVFALAIFVLPPDLLAQTDLASQRLGRGFWHVFAAYAIVWGLVFGWLVRIGRQLARVERSLDGSDG